MVTTAISRSGSTGRMGDLPPAHIIFGCSAAMQTIRQKVEKVASSGVPILIQGDSGTGKGLLTRFIHNLSAAPDAAFVKVNCAAIPGTLLESELFGYEKGAFTGAYAFKPGRVELAEGGTLFLDGIDEIDKSLQAKLLQLLQDGQFSRIGGQEDRHVHLRVICATNRQIEQEVTRGRFRQDLFYRINVVTIQLPPLRARSEDIGNLVAYFLETHGIRHNVQVRPLSPVALRLLERHPWPGNIRELENLIERYVILDSEDAVSSELLNWEQTHTAPEIPMDGQIHLKKMTRQAVHDLERKIILRVLEANRWNRKRTASALKISYRALLYKIRRAGLPAKRVLASTAVVTERPAITTD
ncbi:MAG: sigma 54-interacting transcriptional regulator [Acidobacteriia bacterium]|nr:sigma 54-interacting transcriptional regulator [Terriglobia bacterium]